MQADCKPQGDADLYGLGVRIASYISWFTTVVAYHKWPDKTIDSLVVNCILQLSLLVATIHKITTNTAHTGEVFLMTFFGAGGGFAIMIETLIETKTLGFGSTKFAEFLRALLLLAYSVLSVWFWYRGRHVLVGS
ncbi:hypothetical protein SNK03_13633 [Fusarium graminearum]|uniref:Chromosome 3, complete genome n=1 Tax=Gibberella zeae (strain ATCC MYA-4620 / CBS 123657 / FGSC 9075 / NRRL 31084 / PH-1) TaxID=229533 RepID=I1S6Z6_GIBZE|nr:hypothetical protein FGSG_12619 [Fusarium graminearum PH-1]ESU10686.1 hypothetical protein FGSG_12619 [Fusarium graminearum PH-1]EYB27168.1 hypothetical protein FG05_12619 [Fusarium graminearum]CEF88533.1 unnamed protein product [Fusarium graminearum]|eukprot:XP_011323262.1 hypothetical protein FGSG_12619 [Fusarium graminearum PH-1]